MKQLFGAVFGILIVFAWSGLAAGKQMHACALLTSSEVVAAVGGMGHSLESDIHLSEGPSKGETLGECMWAADNQGMVSLSIMRTPHGALRDAGLAKRKEGFQQLKAKGWAEEQTDFSNANCARMTPPSSSKKDTPVMTGCFAEAKGMGISVGYMGRTRVPIEQVKTLLDKALERLP